MPTVEPTVEELLKALQTGAISEEQARAKVVSGEWSVDLVQSAMVFFITGKGVPYEQAEKIMQDWATEAKKALEAKPSTPPGPGKPAKEPGFYGPVTPPAPGPGIPEYGPSVPAGAFGRPIGPYLPPGIKPFWSLTPEEMRSRQEAFESTEEKTLTPSFERALIELGLTRGPVGRRLEGAYGSRFPALEALYQFGDPAVLGAPRGRLPGEGGGSVYGQPFSTFLAQRGLARPSIEEARGTIERSLGLLGAPEGTITGPTALAQREALTNPDWQRQIAELLGQTLAPAFRGGFSAALGRRFREQQAVAPEQEFLQYARALGLV